jgi:[ribosomal protein S5]-alanine N-acetyltransferase
MPATLHTPDLTLRRLIRADAPALFAYASDPHVTKFTSWQHHQTLADTARFLHTVTTNNTLIWGILHNQTQTLIGECRITPHDNHSAELQYALAQPFWGQGLATQATTAVVQYAFMRNLCSYIQAWIITDNIRSQKLAQRIGMEHTHTLPQHWLMHGQLHDVAVYTLKK